MLAWGNSDPPGLVSESDILLFQPPWSKNLAWLEFRASKLYLPRMFTDEFTGTENGRSGL